MDESRDRPGLVAAAVGATMTWFLDPGLVSRHLRAGVVRMYSLKSYEHMGRC